MILYYITINDIFHFSASHTAGILMDQLMQRRSTHYITHYVHISGNFHFHFYRMQPIEFLLVEVFC